MAQRFALPVRRFPTCWDTKLALGVLEQAMRDYERRPAMRDEIDVWMIRAYTSNAPLPFGAICDGLGLDIQETRAFVQAKGLKGKQRNR